MILPPEVMSRLKRAWKAVWQSPWSSLHDPFDNAPAAAAIVVILALLFAGTGTFNMLIPASSIPQLNTDFAVHSPQGIEAGIDIARRYAFGMAALLLILTGAIAIPASWHFCAWALSGRQRLVLVCLFVVVCIVLVMFRVMAPNGIRESLFNDPIEAVFVMPANGLMGIPGVSSLLYHGASIMGVLGATAAVLAMLSVGAAPPPPKRAFYGQSAGGAYDYPNEVYERRAGGWTRDRLKAAQESLVPLIGIAAALLAAQVIMVGAAFAWTIPLLTPLEASPAVVETVPGIINPEVDARGAGLRATQDLGVASAAEASRDAERIHLAARTAASGLMLYWGGVGTFILLIAFIAANASLRRGATMIAKAELKKPFSSLRDAAVVSRERQMLPTFWPQMRRLLTVFAPLLATPLTQGFTALLDLGAVIAAGS